MILKDFLKLLDEDTPIIITYYNKTMSEEEECFRGKCRNCPWTIVDDKLDTSDDIPPVGLYTDVKTHKTYMQIYIL